MGRMDGDMAANSTGYEVAVEWRQKCEQLQGRVAELEAKLKTGRQCVAERDEEIERLSTQAKQDQSIVGRGYRSVTVYADGTVEVDRSFDDDDQPASRRTL